MNGSTEIKLSLLDNSHAFMREAVAYAISAKDDARKKWQFAILNLVQSLELSLKSLLFNIHPILIFENIDSPKHTVGPLQALDRLNNPTIGNVVSSKVEWQRIQKAIELRNQMTHSEFILRPEYATAKFFELFAIVVYFQAQHLKIEVEAIIPESTLDELLAIEKAIKELAEKAKQRITDEGIDSELVYECPNCQNYSFVIQDDINTCYTCRYTAETFECEKCGKFFFEWEMEDFSNEFDDDYVDGEGVVYNNYGYDYYSACTECVAIIKDDIAEQQMEYEHPSRNF
ncbi:MAG: hypothetical protein HC877_08995 [Thioploca sp.]|nr:hypothetical protein [Thioploca sp.]